MQRERLRQTDLEILGSWARNIALLPLEEWLEELTIAETVAPFVDPTLFMQYMDSGRGQQIKALIEAALPLKRFVLSMQPTTDNR